MSTTSETETMQCPTCRADQQWSDTCRRCKCDLSLLHQMLKHCRRLHRECLIQLGQGDIHSARKTAAQYHAFRSDDTSRRLLAVCSARAGDMETAVKLAENPDAGA